MNSVFNTLLSRVSYSLLLLILSSSNLLAATTTVNKCASLNLTATNEVNQSVIYELLSNNNSAIENNAYLDKNKHSVFYFQGNIVYI